MLTMFQTVVYVVEGLETNAEVGFSAIIILSITIFCEKNSNRQYDTQET